MGKKGSVFDKFLNITPLGMMLGTHLNTSPPRPPAVEDDAAVEAKERERRRVGSGSRSTVLSQGRANALSGSIGKRLLGGTQ